MRLMLVIAATLGILAAWEWAGTQISLFKILLSSPSKIAAYAVQNWQGLATDTLHTALIAALGLLMALGLGGSVAILGFLVPRLRRSIEGASTIAQAIPLVVFSPFLVILFGSGLTSKALLATIMAVFPIVIGTLSALLAAEREFQELVDLHRIGRRERLTEVYLPVALPSLISTFRVSAALAILGAVIAEFAGSAQGLGRNIFLGTVRLEPELLMISLIVTMALGATVHLALTRIERGVSWWR